VFCTHAVSRFPFSILQRHHRTVAESLGLQAQKADDIYGTAPIIQDIWHAIWTAKVVIADVTGRNPNVNYELGLCHALGVPTVLITQNLDDVAVRLSASAVHCLQHKAR
jgi:hypothetical protein